MIPLSTFSDCRLDRPATIHLVLRYLIFSDTSLWYAVHAGCIGRTFEGMRISSGPKGILLIVLAFAIAIAPNQIPSAAAPSTQQAATLESGTFTLSPR